MKYLFINNKSCPIKLPDKNGRLVSFSGNERKVLDEYFKRYVPNHLSVMKMVKNSNNNIGNISINRSNTKTVVPQKSSDIRRQLVSRVSNKLVRNGNVVGRVGLSGRKHATEFSVARIKENSIAISNNIGIGILSFNRLSSLMALVESIRKYTDLNKTTIFVSDESTDKEVWDWLQKQNDIVAFHNDRKGIAVNSNRLLRCLSRFKYKMVLNDDVEVIKSGWDSFYFDAMERTGLKHFCYRQEGIYGATRPRPQNNGLIHVDSKPHGAVLAIHEDAFRKVGYFDESFGKYGFEHVDYSDRIARACHDKPGYFDVSGSDRFFKIYNDATSDPNKHENYANAKNRYEAAKKDQNRIKIGTSKDSEVAGVTCIIPFRDIGRSECIRTVINNMRAQRYPVIQIILAEQDEKSKINLANFPCVDHIIIENWHSGMHFCKSAALNSGASISKFEKLILHDADMLVRSDYIKKLSVLLDNYESAHIGETVCYMEKESTDKIVKEQSIDKNTISSDRIVKYYEGGSFGITKSSYHRIGGFCEDFIGYGNEDTEFFRRMVNGTKNFNDRSIDLFHLWHDRTDGWIARHDANKAIQTKMFRENRNNLESRLRKYLDNKYKGW